MDIFPKVVSKEFIVLHSQEGHAPDQLTDGQLLSQLHETEKQQVAAGDVSPDIQERFDKLLDEARRRFLISSK